MLETKRNPWSFDIGNVLGNTPEFIDKSAVYSNEEKFGMFSMSTGTVSIELDVIMKDFNLHGIDFL